MYNKGGWIAKAGSCKIGLKPKPFSGIGVIFSKGFDVSKENKEKPNVMRACVSNDFRMNLEFFRF